MFCLVVPRYQTVSNRAFHLPMRATRGFRAASLRAAKDVSPFCLPVLHPIDRAASGVSWIGRVVLRAPLLPLLSVENNFPSFWQRVCRKVPGLRVSATNLLLANAHTEQPANVDTLQQKLALISDRATRLFALCTHT